jgi:hypothetical protein
VLLPALLLHLAPLFAREGCGDCGYFEKIRGLLE